MAKYSGLIGFSISQETTPGVWEPKSVEKHYQGNMIRNVRKSESSENLNDNFNISNTLSIVADPFANENLQSIRYVIFMNSKWKVTNVEVQRPRLILTLGGVFNG